MKGIMAWTLDAQGKADPNPPPFETSTNLLRASKALAVGVGDDRALVTVHDRFGHPNGLVRVTPSGLDSTFRRRSLNDGSTITVLAPEPSGRVLVGALVKPPANARENSAVIRRFDEDGNLDTSFGDNGAVRLDGVTTLKQILADDRGAYVHTFVDGGHAVIELTRLTSTGQRDPSFGDNGMVTLPTKRTNVTAAFAVDPRGRVLVLDEVGGYPRVARLLPNGSIDRSFYREGEIDADQDCAERECSAALRACTERNEHATPIPFTLALRAFEDRLIVIRPTCALAIRL